MAYKKGRHPGAVWRKTDFQVHTPRDADWSGSGPLPGGTAEAESAREQWADNFIQECLKRNLGAIGITDHHDITFYPYIQRAIERASCEDKIWMFPGMEVTCTDSVQCLVLFDSGETPSLLGRLFGLMPRVTEPPKDDGRAPQANLCGKDIKDFLGALFEQEAFKGKIIVLPHASKGGHKDILRVGFHQRFAELEVDGVYNEKNFSELDQVTLNKIYGKIKDWGDRRHGIITTGDNRSEKYERLGVNPCWIRLGEPTAESIRQAVLADEARIDYNPPAIPGQRVIEMRIHSSLTGPLFEITFNDGFNALIGGRGAGKSAILEYLRFGLGRSTIDTNEDTSSDRERNLIKSTLAGGFVEIDLERDGVQETWRRTLDKQSTIEIRSSDGTVIELQISAAHERFRARAFSQKQLSTLVRKPDTADEQITGIAAAEIVDMRRQSALKISTCESEIRSAFQLVVQGWAAEVAHERAKITQDDLKRRIEATRTKLKEGGLTPEQQTILDSHSAYMRTADIFRDSEKIIDEKLKSLIDPKEILPIDWAGTVNLPSIANFQASVLRINEFAKRQAEALAALIKKEEGNLVAQRIAFSITLEEFQERYETASTAQKNIGNILSDFKRLSSEFEESERTLHLAAEQVKKFATASEHLSISRKKLTDELTVLRRHLNEAATRVQQMSVDALRAHVEDEREPIRILGALSELCEKCGIRDLDQRCRDKVATFISETGQPWEDFLQRLLNLRQNIVK